MLPRNLKRTFHYLPYLLVLRFGRQFREGGIRLVVPFQDRSRAELLRAKVVAALNQVHTYSPKHYKRIQKFTPNVLVLGAHTYIAVSIFDLELCDISRDYALSGGTTAERLAMVLVHEATHGYLHSRGIPYDEERRARIERICVRTEIALASRLPQADALVNEARQSLEYEPYHWTNESFLQRDLQMLTKAGLPRFLIRRLERIQSGRLRARAGKRPA